MNNESGKKFSAMTFSRRNTMEKRIKVEFTTEELKLIRMLCRGEIVFLKKDIELNMAVYGKSWTLSKIDTAKKIQ